MLGSQFHKALRVKVRVNIDDRLLSVKGEDLPRLLRVPHIEAIDLELVILEAANLEHEAIVNYDEGWVDLADWNVRKLRPLACEDIVTEAFGLANGHRAHTHVEHQFARTTCHDNLLSAQTGCMGPSAFGHGGFLHDEAPRNVHLEVLVQHLTLFNAHASHHVHVGLKFAPAINKRKKLERYALTPAGHSVVESLGELSNLFR